MLSIMLHVASWTVLCIIYTHNVSIHVQCVCVCVCVSDNDSAIVEPTQPTELRCDHLQC